MANKAIDFVREYILGLSILTLIWGIFFSLMGVIWFWFNNLQLGFYSDIINYVGNFNAYMIAIGFLLILIGTWYLYSYHKNKKFILEEININKRSDLTRKHGELKKVVKHMPSKYKKMLKEKEEELNLK